MDKTWMGEYTKDTAKYMAGVASFIDFAETNYKLARGIDPSKKVKKIVIPCPCRECVNHHIFSTDTVGYHLLRRGMDLTYTNWTKHGEEETRANHVQFEENTAREASNFGDSTNFTSELPTDATETIDMVNATEDAFLGNQLKFNKLLEDAGKPLYEGCKKYTKLSSTVRLLNIKSKNGLSDAAFTELASLIKDMLPDDNEFCDSAYSAKRVLKAMGSGYIKIHACPNNCILYRHDYEDNTECPRCGISRWKQDKKKTKYTKAFQQKLCGIFR